MWRWKLRPNHCATCPSIKSQLFFVPTSDRFQGFPRVQCFPCSPHLMRVVCLVCCSLFVFKGKAFCGLKTQFDIFNRVFLFIWDGSRVLIVLRCDLREACWITVVTTHGAHVTTARWKSRTINKTARSAGSRVFWSLLLSFSNQNETPPPPSFNSFNPYPPSALL